MIEAVSRPRKRLFLALILLSLIISGFSIYGIWKISFPGLAGISNHLPTFFGTLLVLFLLAIAFGIVGIVVAIMGLPTPRFFQGLAWSAINLLFPLAIQLGKIFDIEKERTERSFIEVSNHLVKQKHVKVSPEKLLILTPHCIQAESCPFKITRDIHNCHKCGKCQVGKLLELKEKYNINIAVVTGGTLARKVVKTIRPKAILAIACERDLTSGIQDVFPLPVIGILNERPFGPCCNTRVDLSKVEAAIQDLIILEKSNNGE